MLDSAFQLFTDKGIAKTSISDIVESSGVAKGTFYLYFKDKFDIRNKLVVYQSTKVLREAYEATMARDGALPLLEDKVVFFVGHVLDQLTARPDLINLISKNLSWGIFKNALSSPAYEDDINFTDVFHQILQEAPEKYRDPEIMLFMIVELVSSTCYSVILYNEPVGMDKMKPYLYQGVRNIIHIYQLEDCTENN